MQMWPSSLNMEKKLSKYLFCRTDVILLPSFLDVTYPGHKIQIKLFCLGLYLVKQIHFYLIVVRFSHPTSKHVGKKIILAVSLGLGLLESGTRALQVGVVSLNEICNNDRFKVNTKHDMIR